MCDWLTEPMLHGLSGDCQEVKGRAFSNCCVEFFYAFWCTQHSYIYMRKGCWWKRSFQRGCWRCCPCHRCWSWHGQVTNDQWSKWGWWWWIMIKIMITMAMLSGSWLSNLPPLVAWWFASIGTERPTEQLSMIFGWFSKVFADDVVISNLPLSGNKS